MASYTAGRFTVSDSGEIIGPRAYMESDAYADFARKIEHGPTPAVILAAPPGTPTAQVIAVALQTDYAAWEGLRQTLAGLK